ncbi:hypothetical protein JW905_00215 [bacterium]|nr:hypothetical protein [candidate division CSSED10-310 bacterium]
MKVIVVSGAQSNVGKTTLARRIAVLLPGAVRIKLGSGPEKPPAGECYYARGTSIETLVERHAGAPFLVIESNRILDECEPDLLIYLTGGIPKPSAVAIAGRAHMVRGMPTAPEMLHRLAETLHAAPAVVRRIAWLSGARPERTELCAIVAETGVDAPSDRFDTTRIVDTTAWRTDWRWIVRRAACASVEPVVVVMERWPAMAMRELDGLLAELSEHDMVTGTTESGLPLVCAGRRMVLGGLSATPGSGAPGMVVKVRSPAAE